MRSVCVYKKVGIIFCEKAFCCFNGKKGAEDCCDTEKAMKNNRCLNGYFTGLYDENYKENDHR